MAIDHAELGKLVEDYRDNHAFQAQLKRDLKQVSERLTSFANTLQRTPESASVADLDPSYIGTKIDELRRAIVAEKELRQRLELAGFGFVVAGIETQRAPTPDLRDQLL